MDKKLNTLKSIRFEKFSKADISITCDITEIKARNDIDDVTLPKVLSYDIECVSDNKTGKSFPNPSKRNHPIISISATIGKYNETEDEWRTFAFVNAEGNRKVKEKLGNRFHVVNCSNEKMLLKKWFMFIQEENPDVILSFNGLSFDDNYVFIRTNIHQIWGQVQTIGRIPENGITKETMEWESSAYGKQKYNYLDISGILHLDMMVYAKKNFGGLPSYSLNNLSKKYLQRTKYDLPIPTMTQYYYDNTPEKMLEIIKYCNEDTILPLLLMKRWMVWFSLQEMSNVVKVSISNLLIRGQSLKAYSQIYYLCTSMNIVVSSKNTDYIIDEKNNEHIFQGATVQTPETGYWKRVATFDFKSLYPTTMIAYNLCYSSYIPDTITDEQLHKKYSPDDYYLFEYEEHQGCEHDTTIRKSKGKVKLVCGKRRCRFFKSHIRKGILCNLLENLLDSRANTRKQIKQFKSRINNTENPIEKEKLQTMISLYDCRQLQYKVSANSMYGFVGSLISPLPFFPVAATTTYLGRINIQKSIDFMKKKHKGTITVYGDTDSCFIYFPIFKTVYDTYKGCEKLEEEINDIFPKPMYLELEKVYSDLFLLSKKRYIGYIVDKHNQLIEVDKKGLVLKRRDNCQYVKDMYSKLINLVMKESPKIHMFSVLNEYISNLMNKNVDVSQLLLNSSINGGYKVDGKRVEFDQILKKEVDTTKIKLPQVQVALKMYYRGKYIQAGDRIDYVLLDNGFEKAYMKSEDYDYYLENRHTVKIDYLYYLKNKIANPIDEIFEVRFGLKKVVGNLVYMLEKNMIQPQDISKYFISDKSNFIICDK